MTYDLIWMMHPHDVMTTNLWVWPRRKHITESTRHFRMLCCTKMKPDANDLIPCLTLTSLHVWLWPHIMSDSGQPPDVMTTESGRVLDMNAPQDVAFIVPSWQSLHVTTTLPECIHPHDIMAAESEHGLDIDSQQEVAHVLATLLPMIMVVGTHHYIPCLLSFIFKF